MAIETSIEKRVPWWKEPTKEQWHAWFAAWLGWTLDAFDFTVIYLIMVPVAKEFRVPLPEVALAITFATWTRLIGAIGAGWLADRIGRKIPLMISIALYSACNFIAGFAPTFWFLLLFRTLLGFGMGAEWPAGAALAMETWPQRSRGIMSGALQTSFSLGFMLSSLAYGLLYSSIGWRGMLWLGILPAFSIVYIRSFVKEPAIWVENRRRQLSENREVRVPLFAIFRRGMIGNTLTACWWTLSGVAVYVSLVALFPTHLEKDLHFNPGLVAIPMVAVNLVRFLAAMSWGRLSDYIGRRWSMILPALIAIMLAPFSLLSTSFGMIVAFFVADAAFGSGGMYGQIPSYLAERYPTEVRATASGFCLHVGGLSTGVMAPVIAYFAVTRGFGFAAPMLIATLVGCLLFIVSLLVGPETKGKALGPEVVLGLGRRAPETASARAGKA